MEMFSWSMRFTGRIMRKFSSFYALILIVLCVNSHRIYVFLFMGK